MPVNNSKLSIGYLMIFPRGGNKTPRAAQKAPRGVERRPRSAEELPRDSYTYE